MTSTNDAQRDEMARDIFLADNSYAPEDALLKAWEEGAPEVLPYAHNIADGLIAKGYRKPRIITTDEELEALAPDTIIRDSGEDPLELFDDGHGTRGWFIGYDRMTPMLPATVLWEPEA